MDTDGLWILQCISDKEYFINKFWRWQVNKAFETIRLRKQVELYEENTCWLSNLYYNDYEFAFNYLYPLAILPAVSEVLFAILPAVSEVLFAILPLSPKFYLQYCQLSPKFYLQYCQLSPKFYLQYCQLSPKFYLQYCQLSPKFYLQYCQLSPKFYLQYCQLSPKFYLQYCQLSPKFYLRIRLDFSLEMNFHLRITVMHYFAQKPRTLIKSQLEIERKLLKSKTTYLARVLIEGLALNFSAYNT